MLGTSLENPNALFFDFDQLQSRDVILQNTTKKAGKNRPFYLIWRSGSVARHDAVDQFLHGRNIAVGIERIFAKLIGIVTGKHQFMFDIGTMCDALKRLLNAEGPRIGTLACRAFVLFPVGELAL